MPATIKDIARQLNISISTVSYALNGGPRSVPADVRAKVLAVARELNYRPNRLARSMATGRTDTIAIVQPAKITSLVHSPYVLTVLDGLVETAEQLQQDILLLSMPSNAPLERVMHAILGGKADSVVLIAPALASPLPQEIARQQFPCAVLSADGPPGVLTITADNHAATEQAMDYLTRTGHRDIAHLVGLTAMRDGRDRLLAYREYMTRHRLPLREEWLVPGDFRYQAGYQATRQLLQQKVRPTAILAGNDESGIAAVDAAESLGLHVPQDLSVIGFDVLPQTWLHTRRITSVRQPIHDMAAYAVQQLTQWVREGLPPTPDRVVLPTEVADFGSVSAPPARK